ncbi:MAG: lipid-binding SYLF domain-containing protein [Candidatus Omnitrophota bacterium]
MKKVLFLLIAASLVLGLTAYADDEEGRLEKRVDNSVRVINEIMEMPEKGIPKNLLEKCSAIAIFPTTLKGGFIWGGRYGQGVVLAKDKATGQWSPPAFFTIGEVSWGLQIGGQAIDLVLVIMGDNALKGLLKDNFTLGGDASVAAGPIGRDTSADTDLLLKGGIFSYSRAKGLFAGATLKGAVMTPNNVANRTYYGDDVSAKDILVGAKVQAPANAQQLVDALLKYSK